ncbi:MAG: hypothetical protein PWQ84_1692 [Thermotogaceae bacterium]|nr:hypothetical protein [Thermotogaceae bacterium]
MMKGDKMRRRKGIISISIAIIMLLFSLIATMVISNISSNLYKNIVVMDEDKELQYRRIVVMSLKNAADAKKEKIIKSTTTTSMVNFTFSLSEGLMKNPDKNPFTFPATATVAATNVRVPSTEATFSFVELYTKHENDTENYGIVVQYKSE